MIASISQREATKAASGIPGALLSDHSMSNNTVEFGEKNGGIIDVSNIARWAQYWNVTLIQIEIAVSRVGDQPDDVLIEIRGLDTR